MAKKEKLEARVRNNPRNVSLADFESLARWYGHIIEGSKHPQIIIGNRVFPYKRTNPVHSVYVTKLIELIDNLRSSN